MLVWVLTINPNRRFYEKIGGRAVAKCPIKLGPETVNRTALEWSDLRATLRTGCKLRLGQ